MGAGAGAGCRRPSRPGPKADLIRHLGELLPDDVACRDDAAAAALLTGLAHRALAGDAGSRCWRWRRRNGRACPTRCAARTGAACTARTARPGTPPARSSPWKTAARPGARTRRAAPGPRDRGAAPRRRSGAAGSAAPGAGADRGQAQQATGSGLRLDQAAAAFLALTSDRRAEVLAGPAGSGKTRTAAEVARIWRQAGHGARCSG